MKPRLVTVNLRLSRSSQMKSCCDNKYILSGHCARPGWNHPTDITRLISRSMREYWDTEMLSHLPKLHSRRWQSSEANPGHLPPESLLNCDTLSCAQSQLNHRIGNWTAQPNHQSLTSFLVLLNSPTFRRAWVFSNCWFTHFRMHFPFFFPPIPLLRAIRRRYWDWSFRKEWHNSSHKLYSWALAGMSHSLQWSRSGVRVLATPKLCRNL